MLAPWPRPLTPRRRRALARDVEEELRAHIAMRSEENERAGMAPAEAEADALARFGDVAQLTEACLWAEQTHPAREAQRLLVTGLLFAIGFGAFATAFSLAYAVWVRPLRFAEADRLVRSGAGWEDARIAYGHAEAWRTEGAGFERLTVFDAVEFASEDGDSLRAMLVTEDYFRVFDVAPLLGRALEPNGREEVVISETLWSTRFQRSRSVLGAPLALDGEPHTIVGVMPETAQLSHRVDLWHRLPQAVRTTTSLHYVVGRLRPGVALADVREDVARLGTALPGPPPRLYPLKRIYAQPVRSTVRRALGASGALLLLVMGVALWRALVRARLAARYGSGSEGYGVQTALALAGAMAGLGLARAAQPLVYDGLLGRWGPMFDRSLDAPVVGSVLGLALLFGAVLTLGAWWGTGHAQADG